MPRQEHRGADKAAELVIRGTQDRHVLVAKPPPELLSRRGLPTSTNERANSITVLQARCVRVWARLFEPVLGVQFSGVEKWQAHNYSNQQQHGETFSFQWDSRANRVILSGRQFGWIMKGCVFWVHVSLRGSERKEQCFRTLWSVDCLFQDSRFKDMVKLKSTFLTV